MRCLSFMVGVALLGACGREPAHTAVEPATAVPVQPPSGGAIDATDTPQGAAQASTPQPAPSQPSATKSPANPDANTDTGSGTKVPSSTQARDRPPAAEIPNAMPQPDPL